VNVTTGRARAPAGNACRLRSRRKRTAAGWATVLAVLTTLCAVTPGVFAGEREDAAVIQATPALNLQALSDLDAIIASLADARVVFVGEQHDLYEHHLTQLEIIRRLHARYPELAIGMEAFQQPFQSHLDAYVAGELSETELLRNTEYFSRWGIDFRLYAPILRFAREQRLPVVALNLPREITRKVGRAGIESLGEEERAQLPAEIDRSDAEYERRLSQVFNSHRHASGQSFEHFLQVQLLWDEGMAERAANYLIVHPERRMVVLAGNGHLAYGSGIPQRLLRRLPTSSAVVLNGWQDNIEARLADFLLFPQELTLPPVGRLGAVLDERGEHVGVVSCAPDTPCQAVGLTAGDRLVSINGQAIAGMADVKLALWDKRPGERVQLEVSRKRWILPRKTLSLDVELQAVQ
jgi:uncharacterized iron-regulated protein